MCWWLTALSRSFAGFRGREGRKENEREGKVKWKKGEGREGRGNGGKRGWGREDTKFLIEYSPLILNRNNKRKTSTLSLRVDNFQ